MCRSHDYYKIMASSSIPMCRSLSSESQKKDWGKRLSFRGNHKSKEVCVCHKRTKIKQFKEQPKKKTKIMFSH